MMDTCIARSFVDARVQSIYGGSNEIMKELIARTIVKPVKQENGNVRSTMLDMNNTLLVKCNYTTNFIRTTNELKDHQIAARY